MKKQRKIAVIGGGSTYTPELVEGFARRWDVLPVDELVLYDIDGARLNTVGGLGQRILDKAGFRGRLTLTTDLQEAVRDADAVLLQIRVGGQQTRLLDETLPNKVGLIGQETTGPGGFGKALRTVPVILEIADEVRRLAGPDTWIVDFTNPVGIVTRQLLDAGHRAIGLCNVAIGFQRFFAEHFDVHPDEVRLGHAGLNHLTWIRSVQIRGEERLPELLDGEPLKQLAERVGLDAGLLRTTRAIPSYYLHYFYATTHELTAQMEGGHRAQRVIEIERELLEMYTDPCLDHKPQLLEQRGGAWYSEAAAALVTSLLTGDGAHHYVNVRNNGTVAGLPDEAVVEVGATVGTDGAHPVKVPDMAPEMLGLIQAVTSYEVLAGEAARTGDRDTAIRALMAHPLVREWDLAVGVLDVMASHPATRLAPTLRGDGA